MLDITITRDGELGGLICCEQQGTQREWKSEDIIFVTSVADVVSLAYRSVQRRDYEKKLRQQSKEITQMNEKARATRERTDRGAGEQEQPTYRVCFHQLASPSKPGVEDTRTDQSHGSRQDNRPAANGRPVEEIV